MTSIPVYCVRCNGDNKEFIDFKSAYDYAMSATNRGKDLPEHRWHVVMSALRDDLGQGTKLLFAGIYRELITKEAEAVNRDEQAILASTIPQKETGPEQKP